MKRCLAVYTNYERANSSPASADQTYLGVETRLHEVLCECLVNSFRKITQDAA